MPVWSIFIFCNTEEGEEHMKKILYYLPSIIFNVIEMLVIFLVGISLRIPIKDILLIFILFAIIRIQLGGALHYKSPIRCAIWSTIVFASLFIVSKVGPEIAFPIVIFSGYILTTKGNIQDILMWKSGSNYMDIDEFIKYAITDDRKKKINEFEKRLRSEEPQLYDIYSLRFKEGYKHYQIQKMLDISGSRLTEKLNRIATSFRIFCK